ncbi:Lipoprotein-releasing system ATP-binding protein LolD [bioreactor metagenome]|uniref:Lipoprotein-releasing system ATP-binding protein LolD n=1 Tax=bioreactor metagenome TaxID=1076179 RepID=A0A645HES1_9ZZZZ
MEIVGAPSRLIRRRVPIVLSIVGLRDKANARPGELSGGEQQRVAIARAMVNNPMIILADEPTGNLDHRIGAEVMALLEGLHHAGTTLIVVTHDRELGARAHRHIAMRDGEIVGDEK